MTTATEDREEVVATTPEGLREQALVRLKKRRDLNAHAFVYVLVNAVIWGIWVAVGVGSHSWWPWPVFVTLFWGIGLVMNAWDVYIRKPITEEEVRREIAVADPDVDLRRRLSGRPNLAAAALCPDLRRCAAAVLLLPRPRRPGAREGRA